MSSCEEFHVSVATKPVYVCVSVIVYTAKQSTRAGNELRAVQEV